MADTIPKIVNRYGYSGSIEAQTKKTKEYIKNIFEAYGSSFNDFYKATGKRVREYKINGALEDILKSKIQNKSEFESRNEIFENVKNCNMPYCGEYAEIIDEFLKENFQEKEYHNCRAKIKKKIEEIAKKLEDDGNTKINDSKTMRTHMNMALMMINNTFINKIILDVDRLILEDNCNLKEKDNLSEFSVSVLKLLKINKILDLQLQQIRECEKLNSL